MLVLQRITEIAGVVVSLDPKPIPVSFHFCYPISQTVVLAFYSLIAKKKNDMNYGSSVVILFFLHVVVIDTLGNPFNTIRQRLF